MRWPIFNIPINIFSLILGWMYCFLGILLLLTKEHNMVESRFEPKTASEANPLQMVCFTFSKKQETSEQQPEGGNE